MHTWTLAVSAAAPHSEDITMHRRLAHIQTRPKEVGIQSFQIGLSSSKPKGFAVAPETQGSQDLPPSYDISVEFAPAALSLVQHIHQTPGWVDS